MWRYMVHLINDFAFAFSQHTASLKLSIGLPTAMVRRRKTVTEQGKVVILVHSLLLFLLSANS